MHLLLGMAIDAMTRNAIVPNAKRVCGHQIDRRIHIAQIAFLHNLTSLIGVILIHPIWLKTLGDKEGDGDEDLPSRNLLSGQVQRAVSRPNLTQMK